MNGKQKILCIGLWLLSILCLGYFILLMVSIGPLYSFNYVWLMGGLFFLGLALTFTYSKKGFYWMPKPVLVGVEFIVLAGLLLFVVIESLIIKQSVKAPEAEGEYLVILGAKVNGVTPSHILKKRIEKAYEYMKEHPKCKVVVSGGKGADEGISEAEAMYRSLCKLGIEKERIILEDQSTNTRENLKNTKEILRSRGVDLSKTDIIIVTTDFHMLRALKIAGKLGYANVEGLASGQVWYLIPTNYVREFLAIIKDFLMGNL